MFSYLYQSIIFRPLYNGLILLFDIGPWVDAGIAVIVLTIIVRLILFPLSKKAVITQVRMKEIEPELNKLKQTVTDKQQQALKVMELYKTKGINPFSSFFLILIQLPVIIALYSVFIRSGLPNVNEILLYHGVAVPHPSMEFLGLIDISTRSIALSVLAAIAQFLQLHFSFATRITNPITGGLPLSSKSNSSPIVNSPQAEMAQNMTRNMKYVFPVIIFFISYKISAVVALYLTVSSLFTLGQELVVRRHLKKHQPL